VRKRRQFEVFTLSFLDVICCGFGAVVLVYTIISANAGVDRSRRVQDLSAEVSKLEEEVLEGTRGLVVLRNTLEKTDSETASAAARANQLIDELRKRREESSQYDETTVAQRERIEKLKADVLALEKGARRLEAGSRDIAPLGDQVKAVKTKGADRRYITGLRLRGKRILVLIDRSASMLDADLVNIIRLRNSSEADKRSAPKWRRAVSVVNWITAQIPPASKFQVYAYNVQAAPVAESTETWLDAGDAGSIDKILEGLDNMSPENGTSLINAFAAARAMSPQPDQIVLITDGLPTQGASPPALRKYIDAGGRAKLFDEAVKTVSTKTPIDVILMPLKGDNPAAHRFWRLARNTGGAYMMPSADWP